MRTEPLPVTDPHRLRAHFAVAPWVADDAHADDTDAAARQVTHMPLLRRREDAPAGAPAELVFGRAGLHGACAVEAMKSAPRFRSSWWAGRRCVLPVDGVAGWAYGAGRPERWTAQMPGGAPFGLAALWNEPTDAPPGAPVEFTLLTLPAAGHPVFAHWGPPDRECRRPALLAPEALALWLDGSLQDAERCLTRAAGPTLVAQPQASARPPRREPRSWAVVPDMFAYEWHVSACEGPAGRRTRRAPSALSAPPDCPAPTSGSLF